MSAILVVGATGKQGGAVLAALLSCNPTIQASSIRFLTRNTTSPKAAALTAQGAQAVQGDLLDISSLEKALEGCNRAYLVTDSSAGLEKEVQQGKNFIDACAIKGVAHIVFSSAAPADHPEAMKAPHYASKKLMEDHLEQSGLSYTVLRPVGFFDNLPVQPGFGRYMALGFFWACLQWKNCQWVACEDIGILASKALASPDDPHFKNKKIILSSGDYTYEEFIDGFTRAQGTRPRVAGWVPTSSTTILPHDFKQMFWFLNTYGSPEPDLKLLKEIHPGLLSLEDWIRKEDQKAAQKAVQ